MKAITDKQPWASLIVEGIKYVENRTWPCPKKYIGKRVLIHASQKPLRPVKLFNSMQKDVIKRAGLWETCVFPECGSIIGSVEIVDCVINHPSIWAEDTHGVVNKVFFDPKVHVKKEWILDSNGNYVHKKYAIYNWVLANPIKFPKPIPAKGKLGFWESECEILICPKCGGYCLHDNHDAGIPNWGNPVHECEYCGYMILESEFEYLK